MREEDDREHLFRFLSVMSRLLLWFIDHKCPMLTVCYLLYLHSICPPHHVRLRAGTGIGYTVRRHLQASCLLVAKAPINPLIHPTNHFKLSNLDSVLLQGTSSSVGTCGKAWRSLSSWVLRLWPMPPAVLSVPCSPLSGPLAAACPSACVWDCPQF